MAKINLSKQKISTIMQQGRLINRDSKGGYTVEYEGKRYYIPKDLAIFNVTNPFASQTRKFIKKRDERIAKNESLLTCEADKLKVVKTDFHEFLASSGITLGHEENLTEAQKTKIYNFKNAISGAQHAINKFKMYIRGDLLSNFMDYCSLMKYGG